MPILPLIILELLKTVNLILEGIPVEERRKNYLAFAKFLEDIQTAEPPAMMKALAALLNQSKPETP